MKTLIALLIRYVPRKYLQRLSGLGLRMLGLFYLGNRVECPICTHHYRTFLPYGRVNPRANALCPFCQSLERHRLIWLYLKEKTDFFSTQRDVLHVAPELCFVKRFEKQHKDKYVTADLESPWAQVKMDIHHIPFPENCFDRVFCNHVLEHVEDDIKALREIRRVLRPGGWAILQVPFFYPVPAFTLEDISVTSPRTREKLFGQADHVRKYGRDYPDRIAQAGLVAVADAFGQRLSDEQAARYGVMKNEVIYVGIKK